MEHKFPKMGDFLFRTPMKHRAKFDAASFISSAEKLANPQLHTNTNKKQ